MKAIKKEIFPTLVMEFDLTHELPSTKEIVDIYSGSEYCLMTRGTSNFQDNNWLTNSCGEVGKVVNRILEECIETYVKEVSLAPLKVLETWMNHNDNGSKTIMHRHEGSVLSGALYIETDDHSADLVLHSPLRPYRMNDMFLSQTKYSENFHNISPANNKLVIFPSWLDHETNVNTTNNRYVISFNTVYQEM